MIKRDIISRHLVLHFLIFIFFVLYQDAVAKESKKTGSVIGHKPTLSNVKPSKTKIFYGDTVSITYDYHDIDGDPPMTNLITAHWYAAGVNGLVSVKGNSNVRILHDTTGPRGCAYENVTGEVSIRPVSTTGDPNTGDYNSIKISVELPIAPQFQGYSPIKESYGSAANNTIFLFSEAEALCRSIGKKLPTVAQLKGFIAHYNNIMPLGVVKLLGFPANNMCWGKTDYYWTSDHVPKSQQQYTVSIVDGKTDTVDLFEINPSKYTRLHVMCVP